MKIKSFRLQPTKDNVKSIGEGKMSAVFATLNEIDKDNDVTVPGAFGTQRVRIAPAHDWKAPAMGFADIYEKGNEAIFDATFYLDTALGKEWFTSLKNNFDNGVFQEYSYGFNVEEDGNGTFADRSVRFLKKLKVFEVSPVMLGAGMGTRTLSAKELKDIGELRGSWEEVQDAIEDAAEEMLLPDPSASAMNPNSWPGCVCVQGTYDTSAVVCLYLPNSSEPQYFQFDWAMQPDGSVVLSNQIAVELQTIVTGKSMPVDAHFNKTIHTLLDFEHRIKSLARLRAKEGRVLSQANRDRIKGSLDAIMNAAQGIESLLADTITDNGKDANAEAQGKAVQAIARYQLAKVRRR